MRRNTDLGRLPLGPYDFDPGASVSLTDGMLSPGAVPAWQSQPPLVETDESAAAWTAPESWGVEGDAPVAELSSSEEDDAIRLLVDEPDLVEDEGDMITPRSSGPLPFGAKSVPRRKGTRPSTGGRPSTVRPATRTGRPGTAGSAHMPNAPVSLGRPIPSLTTAANYSDISMQYHIRIYGADGSWITMAFPLNTTTQEMLNALANKTHLTKGAMKLYVRERGQGGRSLVFSPGIMFGAEQQ
jgi:adenylate cyclase